MNKPSTLAAVVAPGASQARARTLADAVGGFTWPELVALELERQEQAHARRKP